MAKLLFFLCVGLLKIICLFKASEALEYNEVWDTFGLIESETSEEVKEVLKSLTALGFESRDPSEFEVDLDQLKERMHVILNKIKRAFDGIDVGSYANSVIELAISIVRKILETAPYDTWIKAYKIAKKDTSLLAKGAATNQQSVWTMWKAFVGDIKQLEEGLDAFLEVSEAVHLVEVIVRAFRKKSKENEKLVETQKPAETKESKKPVETKETATTENTKESPTAKESKKPVKAKGTKESEKFVKPKSIKSNEVKDSKVISDEAKVSKKQSKSGIPEKITAKSKTKAEL